MAEKQSSIRAGRAFVELFADDRKLLRGLRRAEKRLKAFDERHLRRAIEQFVAYYHGERNHQGLGNEWTVAEESVGNTEGEICCRERLGGSLRYDHWAA